MYLTGSWQARPIAEFARDLVADDRWIPLEELFDTTAFRSRDSLVTYGQAGQVVDWIVREHGRTTFLELYATLRARATFEHNARELRRILDLDLPELETRILTDLRP